MSHKQGKSYSFFLSSEYERSQWVETLQVLQASLPSNASLQQASTKSMSMYELQNWITSCRKFLKTNMGSFLMRSPRDEPLLVGDLVTTSLFFNFLNGIASRNHLISRRANSYSYLAPRLAIIFVVTKHLV